MNITRERVTTKDIQGIFGYSRGKALALMKQIRQQKTTTGNTAVVMVLVDDVAKATGLDRERIKAGLVG